MQHLTKSGAEPAEGLGCATRWHVTRHGRITERGPVALLADHATRFLLDHLAIEPGSRVAEPGCGTGVLSIFAALAGAASVVGTDIDPLAIAAARHNAELNAVSNVAFVHGSLLDPVRPGLDLVVALLPHKPAPRPFNHRYYGGPDGTDLLLAVIRQAADRLRPGGRLLLYVNSIANPRRVADEFARAFDARPLALSIILPRTLVFAVSDHGARSCHQPRLAATPSPPGILRPTGSPSSTMTPSLLSADGSTGPPPQVGTHNPFRSPVIP